MPSLLAYKAIDTESGEVIGHGEIGSIDYRNYCGTICRILIGPPEMRGKGYGVQLVKALLYLAFEQLALHRVDLYVFDFNKEAIRCYEAAGFQIEGRMREARKHNDEYWSSYIMSILEHEWRSAYS
jgi:RimJ/RimL family protein N-acetyltransferase